MENEFKVKNPKPPTVPFMKLVIQSLRKQREEHPVLDTAAGFVPFVGGVQSGMDVLDESNSPIQRTLAALGLVPGGKLVSKLGEKVAGKLGIVTDLEEWRKKQKATADALRKDSVPYSPEEIFQKPDLTMTAEQRAANLQQKNEEARKIAEQWLKDNPQ
jgi:hypothetical protein